MRREGAKPLRVQCEHKTLVDPEKNSGSNSFHSLNKVQPVIIALATSCTLLNESTNKPMALQTGSSCSLIPISSDRLQDEIQSF